MSGNEGNEAIEHSCSDTDEHIDPKPLMKSRGMMDGESGVGQDPEHDIANIIASTESQLDSIASRCLGASTTTRKGEHEFTLEDLERLRPRNLLNDKIINIYFKLLATYSRDSVYVFSTFFYTTLARKGVEWVQRWTCKINIFDSRLIYIPVHLPGHWIFVTIDAENMALEYYDSLGGSNREVVYWIRKYLRAEWDRIYGGELKFPVIFKKRIPLQENGYDCGVFVCMFGRYRLEGNRSWLSPKRIDSFRRMMLHEIVVGRILYKTFHPLRSRN